MVIRSLRPEEYPLLKQFPGGFVPDAKYSRAVVGFDGDKPISRMLVVMMPHLEGTFVDEDHRGGSVGYRMLKQSEEEIRKLGLTSVFAYVPNDEVGDYLERTGYRQLPVTVWVKEFPCL